MINPYHDVFDSSYYHHAYKMLADEDFRHNEVELLYFYLLFQFLCQNMAERTTEI